MKLNSQRIGKLKQKSKKKKEIWFSVAQCQKEVYKLANEKRESEAPLLLLLYTPKILYNSRSRKTAQLGTTKIPCDRQKRHRRLSTLTPAKVSQLHAGGKNTGMRELMLLLLGPHNIQFYNRGNIFVQNNTMHSDIFGFGSSGKSLRNWLCCEFC